MPSEVREQLRGLLRDFSSGYPSDKMTDIYLNRILSVIGEEVDKLMWDDYRYCNGDTLEEMERECQVHNDCLTDLRARLEGK